MPMRHEGELGVGRRDINPMPRPSVATTPKSC